MKKNLLLLTFFFFVLSCAEIFIPLGRNNPLDPNSAGYTSTTAVSVSLNYETKLTASDGAMNDSFGGAVALSSNGNTILIGAVGADGKTGSVYIFTKSSGTWFQSHKLTASNNQVYNFFGKALALTPDGKTAVIGATGHINGSIKSGGCFIFTNDGLNWVQSAILTASDGENDDNFGYAVAISDDGTTALIGAYGDESYKGSCYIFTYSGSNWTQSAKIIATDGISTNYFGFKVALSADGKTAVISAIGYDFYKGSCYIFTYSGGNWTQSAKITASDSTSGDTFGSALALTGNGTSALIGASGDNSYKGSCYFFTYSGGNWTQSAKFSASDGVSNDCFGSALALTGNGTYALIGASSHDSYKGTCYFFTYSGGNWTQSAKITDTNGIAYDSFGYAVALSDDGTTALIGAYGDDTTKGSCHLLTVNRQ